MDTRRAIDRITSALAVIACLVFLVQLRDIPWAPLPATDLTPDQNVAPAKKGELNLTVSVSSTCTSPTCVLEGVVVRAFWRSPDGHYVSLAEGLLSRTGTAEFRDLPGGLYWVTAEGPGLERRSVRVERAQGAQTVSLRLGESKRLVMTVLDERGQPIPNATVLVTGQDPLPFGALTDSHGQAQFGRLGSGAWAVKASARGFESVTENAVSRDGLITLRSLAEVQVRVVSTDGKPRASEILVVGARLWPARSIHTDAQGQASIRGLLAGTYDLKATSGLEVSETTGIDVERDPVKVELQLQTGRRVNLVITDSTDQHSNPVAGADVVLVENGLSSFPIQGRTDALGHLELGPFLPGSAVLSVRARGFVAKTATVVPEPPPDPLRIELLRGAKIEGRVVDARGFPVDGASVEIIGSDLDGMPIAETPSAVRQRDSLFAWSLASPTQLLPAGELGIMPGPIPAIPRGNPGGPDLASLGIPFPALGTQESLDSDDWVTQKDGSFVAQPVSPGRLRALIHHPDFVEATSQEVSVGPGATGHLEVVLYGGGILAGRVVDDRGRPAAGARVEVVALAGRFERGALTETDGKFEFTAVPNEVFVSVIRPGVVGRRALRRRAQVAEGRRTELELELPKERGACHVKVIDDHGDPVMGAQVTAISLSPEIPLRETQFTGPEGEVILDEVAGLNAELAVEAPALLRVSQTLKAAPESLSITLSAGLSVTGHVTTTRGRTWVSGATVSLVAGGLRWSGTTDREGAFHINGLPPGPAEIAITHPEYAPQRSAVTLLRPTRQDRVFELPALDLTEGGGLEGTVVDRNGQPVRGARVALGVVPAFLPLGVTPEGSTLTDLSGHFILNGLAPGRASLGAFAPAVGRGELPQVEVVSGRTAQGLRLVLSNSPDQEDSDSAANLALSLGERGTPPEVFILQVASGSEAERAGLRAGDVIESVEGSRPNSAKEARRWFGGNENTDLTLDINRGGQSRRMRVARERVRH